jgi:hypothetical protein
MGTWSFTRIVVTMLGFVLGVAALVLGVASLVSACTQTSGNQDGGIQIGALNGQPFGPIPSNSDLCTQWQDAGVCSLQKIPLALDASAGAQAVLQLNDAGKLILALPSYPAYDGGFPSGTLGQVLVEGSGGPEFATVIGDIKCSVQSGSNYSCTIVALNGVAFDGGSLADGSVLTVTGGQISWQTPAVNSFAVDLTACDGGQCVIAVHGPDGGVVPWFTPGIAVDPGQSTWGVTMLAPADAATAPASIWLTPAPPNPAASTTTGGTPGSVHVVLGTPLSTGNPAAFEVDLGDGGNPAAQLAYDPASGGYGLCLDNTGPCIGSKMTLLRNGGIAQLNATNVVQIQAGSPMELTAEFGSNDLLLWQPNVQFYADQVGTSSVGYGISQNQESFATIPIFFYASNANSGSTPYPNGGAAFLAGGSSTLNGTTGLRGPSGLCLGGGDRLTTHDCLNEIGVELFEGQVGERAVCLGMGTGCGSTDLPASTGGDGVTIFATATPGTACGSRYGAIETMSGGALGYCDANGDYKSFDSIGLGSCAALSPALCTDLFAQSGSGYWASASGGQTTVFGPSGSGTANTQYKTTLSQTFYARTTTNGQIVAINFTDPIHVSGVASFYISGRVIASGSASIDDSIEYVTDLMFNNASGTPADLGTTVERRQSLAYTSSLSGLVATISTNYQTNQVGLEITHSGVGLGAIDWTLKYIAELN